MPVLSPESKLKIINNLEKNNINDVDYQDIVDNIQSMIEKYSPVESKGGGTEGFDYNTLKGMSPSNIQAYFHDNYEMLKQYGISNENIDNFISGLNQSGILPYKAYKTKSDNGGYEWGFFKNIDRYEKAFDRNNKPIYLRYYKDDTYDVLDQQTFNEEKNFNLLPDELKNKPVIPIDESNMPESQKYMMYDKILSYQNPQ